MSKKIANQAAVLLLVLLFVGFFGVNLLDYIKRRNGFVQIPFASTIDGLKASGFNCRHSDYINSRKVEFKNYFVDCSTSIVWKDDFGVSINNRTVRFFDNDLILIEAKGEMLDSDGVIFDMHRELSKIYEKGKADPSWGLSDSFPVYNYTGDYLLMARRDEMNFHYILLTPHIKKIEP